MQQRFYSVQWQNGYQLFGKKFLELEFNFAQLWPRIDDLTTYTVQGVPHLHENH